MKKTILFILTIFCFDAQAMSCCKRRGSKQRVLLVPLSEGTKVQVAKRFCCGPCAQGEEFVTIGQDGMLSDDDLKKLNKTFDRRRLGAIVSTNVAGAVGGFGMLIAPQGTVFTAAMVATYSTIIAFVKTRLLPASWLLKREEELRAAQCSAGKQV